AVRHCFAENVGIPTVTLLPVFVTQNRYGRQTWRLLSPLGPLRALCALCALCALRALRRASVQGEASPWRPLRPLRIRRFRRWHAVIIREITAGDDPGAEHTEEIRCDRGRANLLRRAVLTRHGRAARADGGDILKRSLHSVAQVKIVRV